MQTLWNRFQTVHLSLFARKTFLSLQKMNKKAVGVVFISIFKCRISCASNICFYFVKFIMFVLWKASGKVTIKSGGGGRFVVYRGTFFRIYVKSYKINWKQIIECFFFLYVIVEKNEHWACQNDILQRKSRFSLFYLSGKEFSLFFKSKPDRVIKNLNIRRHSFFTISHITYLGCSRTLKKLTSNRKPKF